MESKIDLTGYIRNGLIAILFSTVWFAFENRNYQNTWYTINLVIFAVAVIFLSFLMIRKPAFRRKSDRTFAERKIFSQPAWSAALLVIFFFTFSGELLAKGGARFVILLIWAALCGALVAHFYPNKNPYYVFASVLLFGGVLYRTGAFVNEVSSSPFSLGWSEGSRFYNASLFYSEKLYGQSLPLPALHPSRYLMQAFPFLLNIDSIFLHRLWQVLLWIGLTGWASWLFASKIGKGLKLPVFWLSAFCFLFFFQGAVYYHLMVCVILILIGYQKDKPFRTLLFVIVASLWAGISRINWIPVPALLAVSLYLIDRPFDGKDWLGYLKWPVMWSVLGVAIAFGSKQFYQTISGENPAFFDSAFSSDLLWSRLLPNSTFMLGVLPAIILVCLPLLMLTGWLLRQSKGAKIHWLRWLGLSGILIVFFVGGMLVSLKIGGGGDLHNLDAFLVFFLLISLSLLSGRLIADDPAARSHLPDLPRIPGLLLMFVCLVPVMFAFMRSGSWSGGHDSDEQVRLQQIQQAVEVINEVKPGPILFVTERQLLTMGEITGVDIVPEYEKVFLMEMAIGNNMEYLQEFYDLLDDHYYSAIIFDQIKTDIQASWSSFADENNSYVRKVTLPVLMDYQLALSWDQGEINLLISNNQPELMERLRQITNQ
ncbi:MAG: hypothetical protein GX603_04295 [Chloroflexi bacterium]|nr:hypothetical protein [Chloroflexota bacterium]